MLFNSLEYLIFLPVTFLLYWFVFQKQLSVQNFLILFVSYVFYGWWDWRFLSLIILSSCIDYFCARTIEKSNNLRIRSIFLWVSLSINLGLLFVFKYFNFFAESLANAFSSVGYTMGAFTLDVILPVGISFYTFQTMSYTIDVYRRDIEAAKDPVAFFAYVSFFPQLVAGPIERAKNLLPQFYQKRVFDYSKAADGLRQILWGLFKKVVVADNCAKVVDVVFSDPGQQNSLGLLTGAVFFAFQIYGDFSGYSDIAIGTARLFGFDLRQNFAFPYFSRDIAEFWRRWHMSLSSWFRDYVYVPLGGSKGSLNKTIRNVFIIFVVSGLWHGANWTFLAWGALNAFYFLPLLILQKNRKNLNTVQEGSLIVPIKDLLNIGLTFGLTVVAWIFFRADSITEAIVYLKSMVLNFSVEHPGVDLKPFMFIAFLIIVEWVQRSKLHALQLDQMQSTFLRWLIYLVIVFVIILFGASSSSFIYFQF